MNFFKKKAGTALVLLAGLLAGGTVTATPVTMDFEGLNDLTSVNSYYDGGCTSGGSLFGKCGGPDYGVVWKNATVGENLGGNRYAGLALTTNATMKVALGFTGGLSFNYYNLADFVFKYAVSVYVGQGQLLAQADLDPHSPWASFELTFNGLAKSVVFNGSPFFITGFDNVTLGVNAPTAVPEPAAIGVFSLGLLMMGAFVGLRRRYN
jgi:hypothetical protein